MYISTGQVQNYSVHNSGLCVDLGQFGRNTGTACLHIDCELQEESPWNIKNVVKISRLTYVVY